MKDNKNDCFNIKSKPLKLDIHNLLRFVDLVIGLWLQKKNNNKKNRNKSIFALNLAFKTQCFQSYENHPIKKQDQSIGWSLYD